MQENFYATQITIRIQGIKKALVGFISSWNPLCASEICWSEGVQFEVEKRGHTLLIVENLQNQPAQTEKHTSKQNTSAWVHFSLHAARFPSGNQTSQAEGMEKQTQSGEGWKGEGVHVL